jgi:uncharacterized membrane protein AbrB (regulator of aidB expression)
MLDRARLGTFGIAAAGAAAFWVVGLPLPLLFGPMFACLAAALLKAPLKGVPVVSDAMRTVLGVAVGAWISASEKSSAAPEPTQKNLTSSSR